MFLLISCSTLLYATYYSLLTSACCLRPSWSTLGWLSGEHAHMCQWQSGTTAMLSFIYIPRHCLCFNSNTLRLASTARIICRMPNLILFGTWVAIRLALYLTPKQIECNKEHCSSQQEEVLWRHSVNFHFQCFTADKGRQESTWIWEEMNWLDCRLTGEHRPVRETSKDNRLSAPSTYLDWKQSNGEQCVLCPLFTIPQCLAWDILRWYFKMVSELKELQ